MIKINVSYGELFDKISILEIKEVKIINKKSLKNVKYELFKLKQIVKNSNIEIIGISSLIKKLKKVNLRLWEIEDEIRQMEQKKQFDENFINLARKVYVENDKRSQIKLQINVILKSKIFEEKKYARY